MKTCKNCIHQDLDFTCSLTSEEVYSYETCDLWLDANGDYGEDENE